MQNYKSFLLLIIRCYTKEKQWIGMSLKTIIKENMDKAFDYSKIKSTTLKDKIKEKIRENAVLSTKARLALVHKTFDDYTNEELEIIISDEERKIIDELKTKSLLLALAALGLNVFI